tara:strand:+ start:898 stop:1116 length:219 start_codon:yes stop_codon:yes gene_type:complete
MVYLLKHIDGIASYVDGHETQREPIEGRIIDAVVYLFLLWGMFDKKENPNLIETPYPDDYKETTTTSLPEFE